MSATKAMVKSEAIEFINETGKAALTLQSQGEKNKSFIMFCLTGKKAGSLEDVRACVLTTCQELDATWPKDGAAFQGYQKAMKSGSIGAATFNRLAAWVNSNIAKDTGEFLTDVQKKANKEAKKLQKEKEEKEASELLKATIMEETRELTIDECLMFLQSIGFKLTNKNGKRILTEA